MKQDLYTVLGVDKKASKDKIKQSYRKKVKKHHPDVGGNEEYFKELTNAYLVLSDDRKRQKYDKGEDVDSTFVNVTLRDKAIQCFLQELTSIINNPSILSCNNMTVVMGDSFSKTLKAAKKKLKEHKGAYKLLKKRKAQIHKTKKASKESADNLVDSVFDKAIQMKRQMIAQTIEDIRVINRTLKIITDYKDDFTASIDDFYVANTPKYTTFFSGTGTTSTWG